MLSEKCALGKRSQRFDQDMIEVGRSGVIPL